MHDMYVESNYVCMNGYSQNFSKNVEKIYNPVIKVPVGYLKLRLHLKSTIIITHKEFKSKLYGMS
jgi:hypothetical protein